MARTVGFISLGCAKNQVDCEQMMYLLRQAGYTLCTELDKAELVVINTCGFIESAKSEAIDNILMVGAQKTENQKLLVTGCLAQRYQQEILEQMPEVDGILGTGSIYDIVSAAEQLWCDKKLSRFDTLDAPVRECGRILTTPTHYAYLKIAEGCDNHCAYCVIPSLRGKFRSRELDACVAEAAQLAEGGVRELIVVAQDTSRYGIDLYGKRMLPELLRRLCAIEKLHWVRVHYCYPDEITDELIETFATEPKLVKYLDIPIQHVNDAILRKMNRRGNQTYLRELFPKLREKIPGLVLRTSLITGLPGEGEAEFEELCAFLKEFRLERVGAFAFSPEEGTAAAAMEYPDTELAVHRAELVSELQAQVMEAYNLRQLGQELEILCEGYDAATGLYYGRSYADSPGIDGTFHFQADKPVATGSFVRATAQKVMDGELYGCVLREEQA